ncbi:hypothetical protein [Wolbachia endosymbiont (group A) of Ectemnius continuus]|uniref:hypothetical protein n=1 Tax=Wolbachia endosymbiont (group A) of Ectemnius continuus TaxID=2954002 RepID=UPI00222E5127|nr:hypothetical protein [Wolbachia endosymbiont (group A) of Ectemnius continuus]
MQQSHPSVSYLDDTILFPGFQCLGTGMTSSLVEIALKSQCSYSYANTKVSFQCPDTGIQLSYFNKNTAF